MSLFLTRTQQDSEKWNNFTFHNKKKSDGEGNGFFVFIFKRKGGVTTIFKKSLVTKATFKRFMIFGESTAHILWIIYKTCVLKT